MDTLSDRKPLGESSLGEIMTELLAEENMVNYVSNEEEI